VLSLATIEAESPQPEVRGRGLAADSVGLKLGKGMSLMLLKEDIRLLDIRHKIKTTDHGLPNP
jgi:hypothetical protein